MASSAFPEPISGIKESLLDAAGDIVYASADNTPARLGIGSYAQVLTVASGIPSWATPSAGALTKIVTGTFTAVANTSTTFDGCFTSTYRNYLVVFNGGASADNHLYVQNRVAGVTQSALQYYGGQYQIGYSGAPTYFQWSNNAYYTPIHLPTGGTTNSCTMTFSQVGNGSQTPGFYSIGYSNANNGIYIAGGLTGISYNADGFILSVPTGTITGTCVVYGLAN